MNVTKRFAADGTALDDCLDQLVEVLAQLLEDPPPAPDGRAESSESRSVPLPDSTCTIQNSE
jgi:hypothetical protein